MQNPIAEIAVIAAALDSGEAAAKVIEALQPEDFFDTDRQAIYTALQALANSGGVDRASLEEALRSEGELDGIGGPARLQRIVDTEVRPDTLDRHIMLVRNAAQVRRLMERAQTILTDAESIDANDSDAVGEAIAESQRMLTEINVGAEDGLRSAEKVAEDLDKSLKRRQETGKPEGVLTGFATLDSPEISYGLENENLYVFMGVPGSGKTTFLLNILRNLTLPVSAGGELLTDKAVPVAFFSLEMSAQKLLERVVVAHARERSSEYSCFTHADLKTMEIDASRLDLLRRSFGEVRVAPIYIDDVAPQSIDRIAAKARALKIAVPELAVVMVDYIQLVRGTGNRADGDQRANSLTDIAYALKNLAKELDLPVVVTGQVLEKEVEKRGGQLQMTDIKESGGIAQAANLMAGLEVRYERGVQVNDGWIGFPILKNRDGDKWRDDRLRFDGKFFHMSQQASDSSPF